MGGVRGRVDGWSEGWVDDNSFVLPCLIMGNSNNISRSKSKECFKCTGTTEVSRTTKIYN